MQNDARRWLPPVLIALALAGSGVAMRGLPELVSLSLDGLLPFAVPEDDELAPRWFAALFVPLVAALVWAGFQLGRARGGLGLARLLFPGVPAPLTQPASIERFRTTYDTIVIWVVVLVLGFHAGLLAAALGSPGLAPRIIAVVLGASMVGIGNVMPRLRPNLVAGVRTRRTLSDPQLWRSTHRFFGFAFVVSGIITIAVGLAAPSFGLVTGIGLLLASTLASGLVALRGRGTARDAAAVVTIALLASVGRADAQAASAVKPVAQTLREVLSANHIAAPDAPLHLDQSLTSYAVLDEEDLFVVAYRPHHPGGSSLADTVHIRVLEKRPAMWRHAALSAALTPRRGEGGAWQLGSMVGISRANGYLYVDTHHNPSSGTILVLDRELRPVAAMNGWTKFLLPDGLTIYEHSAPHFAPTYSAQLSLFDHENRHSRPLYPVAPYDSIRARYIDEVARIYRAIGESWFREHNHHMDPERFDSSVGDVFVANASGEVAFLVQFGSAAGTPATPVIDIAVHCTGIRATAPRCSESRLEDLRRAHPGLSDRGILEALLARH